MQKPVGVPHIIPVIKHIQKPIPFFTALPIHQSVPVPKFVGLPVQVRVPKPVFIHVPKIFPVAKRFPVPVEVNIPKPYIVPIYKHVPVPVPHRVPKVINIIKEVPHYVKKPVPVFVDDHSSDYGGGGGAYTSSSYSNDYGNDHQGGYGNEDHSYGGPHGSGTAHHTSSFNNMDLGYSNNGGLDFNQYQSYNSPQQNNQYGSHYFFNNNKEQGQKSYPAITYPRAHRLPNKSQVTKLKDSTGYQSADGSNSHNNNHASAFELSVEVKQNGMKGNNLNYNKDASAINSQVPVSATNENYYQSIRDHNKPYSNIGSSPTSINSHSTSSNSAESFSQPLFNPSAYAEYTQSAKKNPNDTYMQYSQPVYSSTPAAQTSTASTGIVAEASKSFSNYQPFPSNSYSNGYGMSQQSNNFNSIPHQDKLSSYNDAKSAFPSKSNFDFNNLFKQPITYQPPKNHYGKLMQTFIILILI
ncbi:uncharacterized protein CEXT_814991 [Caerostris extrusa]|uniref:Uncharacterized protein n=1 Tax=Caerostris extrusa TaxID=172846 RepID=A0AAV4R7A5_CAEEX|nr:uncharacterized protein CEXT_814991 [Caerostris extrusa]